MRVIFENTENDEDQLVADGNGSRTRRLQLNEQREFPRWMLLFGRGNVMGQSKAHLRTIGGALCSGAALAFDSGCEEMPQTRGFNSGQPSAQLAKSRPLNSFHQLVGMSSDLYT